MSFLLWPRNQNHWRKYCWWHIRWWLNKFRFTCCDLIARIRHWICDGDIVGAHQSRTSSSTGLNLDSSFIKTKIPDWRRSVGWGRLLHSWARPPTIRMETRATKQKFFIVFCNNYKVGYIDLIYNICVVTFSDYIIISSKSINWRILTIWADPLKKKRFFWFLILFMNSYNIKQRLSELKKTSSELKAKVNQES